MKTIATFSLPHEAHMLRMRLEGAGIPAFLQDENTVQMDWLYSNAIGGVKVQVAEEDWHRAAEYLALADAGISEQSCHWFPSISPKLHAKLMTIEPSFDGRMEYRPCAVALKDGTRLECVYVAGEDDYHRCWEIWPQQVPGRLWVSVDEIVDLMASPHRLPAKFANQIYAGKEGREGYYAFRVHFQDGTSCGYCAETGPDFIPYPEGKNAADVVSIEPQTFYGSTVRISPDYYWCLYSGIDG